MGNLKLAASGDNEWRDTPRTNLFLSAILRWSDRTAAVRLRDLSATGVRLEGHDLPVDGQAVNLSRAQLSADGTIVWREQGRCGIRFNAPVLLKDWLPGRTGNAQQNVDRMLAEVRAQTQAQPASLPPRPPAQDLREVLPCRLAEEIAYVMRLLESLGDDLASEPVVLARHGAKLQNLDICAQVLGHIAKLMVATDVESAVAGIGMDALRGRLLRQSL